MGNLTLNEVFENIVIPHFDNHPLCSRPVLTTPGRHHSVGPFVSECDQHFTLASKKSEPNWSLVRSTGSSCMSQGYPPLQTVQELEPSPSFSIWRPPSVGVLQTQSEHVELSPDIDTDTESVCQKVRQHGFDDWQQIGPKTLHKDLY